MNNKDQGKVTEAQIAVHWQEEQYFHPSDEFVAQANMTDQGIYDRFGLDNFPECFHEYADLLSWHKRWDITFDASDAPCDIRLVLLRFSQQLVFVRQLFYYLNHLLLLIHQYYLTLLYHCYF